ncbi:MAG: hypothetical protein FJ265_05660, partial [Planctomycetes bacterium]|nr:hypothetical protein [Planctomycetota bacterium]
MTLFGLSPAAFWLGAGALAAGLLLLHLLRVRLRAAEVDTLLFFRLAGALQKPRVLPGRPARWLAFALALLALLAGWSAVAAPRSGLDAPSRFVVVEPGRDDAAARLRQARELAAAGLGPRGAVFAATLPPVLLLAAGEPAAALDARAVALDTLASPRGEVEALGAAGARLRPGDELLWLGAAEPATAHGAVHVPVASAPRAALRGVRWQRDGGGRRTLVLALDGAETAAELRLGEVVLARSTAPAGAGELRLGPVELPGGTAEVQCVLAGAAAPLPVPVPAGPPLRVHVDPALPAPLAEAIAALLQADPELEPAAGAAADVVVAGTAAPDGPPRLVLTAGAGGGPRRAVATAASPVDLSLRDRARRDAAALPDLAGARVWIADAAQGGALVAATADAGRLCVHAVDWLLQPATHADVPVLLSAALRALGGRPELPCGIAGQPLAVPAAFPVPAVRGALLPVDGALPVPPPARVLAVPFAAEPVAAPAAPLPSTGLG